MTAPSKPPFPPTDPRFYGEDYYNNDLHDRHWFRNNSAKFRMRWESALRLLQPKPGDVVLELGCASGEHTLLLAPMVARAIGLDFSPDAIRLARAAALRQSSRAQFLQGDVAHLSAFADASIDKVLALDLVEHIADDVLRKMLQETWRVLAPGGRLVIYTPSASHYVERLKARNLLLRQLPGHIAVREGAAYRALLEALPWAKVELDYLPSSYPVFGWVDRLLMTLPLVGPLFRFRILALATKP
ncbi:MAG: class I SAM-dependent methyltransferase [Pseudoxanthomonas sp.]